MTPYYDDGRGIVLYLGSCLDVLPELEPVDHCLTDPPYARDVYHRLGLPTTKIGSGTPGRLGLSAKDTYRRIPGKQAQTGPRLGISNHQYSSTAIEKLAAGFIGSVDELIAPCALEFARLCRRWCLVFSDAESIHRWRLALEDAGLRYVRTGAWVKPDAMPQFSGDRPSVGFEPCTITHAPGPMRWNGGGGPALWTHNTVKGNARERTGHPCPKPLRLMLELVSQFTDPGDLVLDPFAGSGTTLAAAKMLGRRAVGIECSEEYAEEAARRLEATKTPLPQMDTARAVQLDLGA